MPRPIGVTIVGIIILIQGILGLLLGIVALFNLWDNINIIVAIVSLIVAIIYLAVARGLFQGRNGARIIVMIVTIISLIGGIIMLFSDQVGSGIWTCIVAIVVLAILNTGRAKLFFLQ